MSSTLYDISALKPLLEQGEWVLTPNQRLRNRIREAFAATQGPVGITPHVYSLHEWLDSCWQNLQDLGAQGCEQGIVNDLQARTLWKDVIERAGADEGLHASSRLIQQANEALRNLDLWQVPVSQIAAHGDPEDYPLLEWAGAFQTRLQTHGLITREAGYGCVLRAFQSGVLSRLPAIHLESLPDLPPLLQSVVDAAAKRVAPVPTAERSSTQLTRLATASVEEEIRAASLWAHQRLQDSSEEPKGGKESKSIGIIVPDLGTSRDLVERIFTETFEPHYHSPTEARYTLPFNISTGTPLGQTPLVSATLQLLHLNDYEVERYQLRKLFNSPFWGDFGEEIAIRSATIEALNRKGQFHYSPTQIRSSVQHIAEQAPRESHLAFSGRLQQCANEWRRFSSRTTPSEWVQRVLQLLDSLNWPGSRTLDSVEFQQARQWYQLLEKFASLDLVQPAMNYADALSTLQQLANSTPFQAEVKGSPIQILGTLEGEGLQFDYCWVMGMTNHAWPPSPEPNPLLPLPLQRAQQMPRSSVTKEISFADALTQHYRRCADAVVFSYPSQLNEAQMLPSSLVADIAPAELGDVLGEEYDLCSLGLQGFYRELAAKQSLERVDCCYGPPFIPNDTEAVRGGTGILQKQALCPFDAFAALRLGATEPPEPSLGLSAAEKGSIIHNVMASVWRELGSQAGLQENAANLQSLIQSATDKTFNDLTSDSRFSLGTLYLQLEKARACELLGRFFEFEKDREAFTVVATEEELIREFAGLTFRLRIDRVDKTESGQYLIIDYKTGASANVNQWLGERPDEPQMPLYALCYPQAVAGISFASIRAQDPGYCGVVDEAVQAWDPRIKTPQKLSKQHQRDDWQTLLDELKTNLENLVDEYRQGYAAVQPKNLSTALRYSEHLLPLNRLREADFLAFFLNQQDRT